MKNVKTYDLQPTDGRKSFYGKAWVRTLTTGTEVLRSYNTDVIKRMKDGRLIRLWDGWSATTGRHISSFCGLNKKEFLSLPNR